MCKRGNYWLTRHTKKECNEAREGFKRCIHQYLIDNDIDDDFDKDITAIAFNTLTPTAVPTTISNSFFYNDYSVKHFMTLNRLIPIKTAKNIVTSMNNNAFTYGLTGGTEPSTVRHGDVGNKGSDDKVNTENLTVDIDFLDCHFDDNG